MAILFEYPFECPRLPAKWWYHTRAWHILASCGPVSVREGAAVAVDPNMVSSSITTSLFANTQCLSLPGF